MKVIVLSYPDTSKEVFEEARDAAARELHLDIDLIFKRWPSKFWWWKLKKFSWPHADLIIVRECFAGGSHRIPIVAFDLPKHRPDAVEQVQRILVDQGEELVKSYLANLKLSRR